MKNYDSGWSQTNFHTKNSEDACMRYSHAKICPPLASGLLGHLTQVHSLPIDLSKSVKSNVRCEDWCEVSSFKVKLVL